MLKEFKNNLDSGNFTAGVFIDIKKAFDTVDHNILLKKLDYYMILVVLLKKLVILT